MLRFFYPFFLSLSLHFTIHAQLPLFEVTDMQYLGAFRLPAATFGTSSLNYSEGPMEYNPLNHSLFIVGHDHQQAIAEFGIPELVDGDIDALEMGTNLQPFVSHLNAPVCGNNQNINQIAGLKLIDNRLFVNAYEYYDADGNVTNTTLIIDTPNDLPNSTVRGYFSLQGGAGHTAGWISEIPPQWRNQLGGTYITGNSSGIPIISRCSVGPSAFAFTPDTVEGACNSIATIKLLDFSLDHPLHDDLSNTSGENDLWTHLSRATYGFIVPGTRTYMTVGYSGGHGSGVCYKCTQDNGNTCGGYCPPEAADYNQYYWLWDVEDLIAVKNGTLPAYNVAPYDYGVLSTPFENSTKQIGGAAFDPSTGTLYLSIQKADEAQGTYSNPPVIVAYQVSEPQCVGCCQSEVTIGTGDLFSGMTIFSEDFVRSDALIEDYFNIRWAANDFIELLPSFEIQLGSDLMIQIQQCPE